MEQEEYANEGIRWQHIQFQDNQTTIDLIENQKAASVFKLLDEQFMLQASGNDTKLLKNFNTMLVSNRSYRQPDKLGSRDFIICHYAGNVQYEIENFVEKNKDSTSQLITETLSQSQNQVIAGIYSA